jgi:hypothetical protein
LLLGHSYKLYTFTSTANAFTFDGLNLFFNGDNTDPGISVFGALNSTAFAANGSATYSLNIGSIPGAGKAFYTSGNATAVLVEYTFNSPATPPGDVCQPETFAPGGGPDLFGSFTLQIFPSAVLTLSAGSGAPFSSLTLTGTGFAPAETVEIFAGVLGSSSPLGTATSDTTGSFSATIREPSRPLGPLDFYALGTTSHEIGAAAFSVTPALAFSPTTVAPGGSTTARFFGFAPGEVVNIYWDEPRQLVGAANSSAAGSGQTTINIPANAAAGLDALIAIGQTSGAAAFGGVRIN